MNGRLDWWSFLEDSGTRRFSRALLSVMSDLGVRKPCVVLTVLISCSSDLMKFVAIMEACRMNAISKVGDVYR